MTRWSDNVRIFELMALHGIIDSGDADGLRASYTTLRDTLHHLALQALPGRVPVAQFARERALICRCWRQWLDSRAALSRTGLAQEPQEANFSHL